MSTADAKHAPSSKFITLLFGIIMLFTLFSASACDASNGSGSSGGSNAGTVLQEFKGGGTKQTDSFTVPDSWTLKTTCTRSYAAQQRGYPATLLIHIKGAQNTFGDVNINCGDTEKTVSSDFQQGGTVYLFIETVYANYDIQVITGG